MRNFIDSIFGPIIQFLALINEKLGEIGTVAARGLRLDDYFGVFAILGPAWTGVISSLLSSLFFLAVLYVIKHYSGVLLYLKDLIKWW